tara:strand:- start:1907 stop:2254 length:348 start_codon:yes stop_codon:yes gene_type:complete
MNILISHSGVASTLLKHFGDKIGVDFLSLPLSHLGYVMVEHGTGSALVLFIQNEDHKPAQYITQLSFAGLNQKLGNSLQSDRLLYFNHVRQVLAAVKSTNKIFIVKDSEVYQHDR